MSRRTNKGSDDIWGDIYNALSSLGSAAIPEFISMIEGLPCHAFVITEVEKVKTLIANEENRRKESSKKSDSNWFAELARNENWGLSGIGSKGRYSPISRAPFSFYSFFDSLYLLFGLFCLKEDEIRKNKPHYSKTESSFLYATILNYTIDLNDNSIFDFDDKLKYNEINPLITIAFSQAEKGEWKANPGEFFSGYFNLSPKEITLIKEKITAKYQNEAQHYPNVIKYALGSILNPFYRELFVQEYERVSSEPFFSFNSLNPDLFASVLEIASFVPHTFIKKEHNIFYLKEMMFRSKSFANLVNSIALDIIESLFGELTSAFPNYNFGMIDLELTSQLREKEDFKQVIASVVSESLYYQITTHPTHWACISLYRELFLFEEKDFESLFLNHDLIKVKVYELMSRDKEKSSTKSLFIKLLIPTKKELFNSKFISITGEPYLYSIADAFHEFFNASKEYKSIHKIVTTTLNQLLSNRREIKSSLDKLKSSL